MHIEFDDAEHFKARCDADLKAYPRSPATAASLRMQALILAQMNEERSEVCSKDQEALRSFFEMNAALLREVAKS